MDGSVRGIVPRTCLSAQALTPRPTAPPPATQLGPHPAMRNFSTNSIQSQLASNRHMYPAPLSVSIPNMSNPIGSNVTAPLSSTRHHSHSRSFDAGSNDASSRYPSYSTWAGGMTDDHRRSASTSRARDSRFSEASSAALRKPAPVPPMPGQAIC